MKWRRIHFSFVKLALMATLVTSAFADDGSNSPHWNVDRCQDCHNFSGGKLVRFQQEPIGWVCNRCHNTADHNRIHPVDLRPSSGIMASTHESYRKRILANNGNLSCTVCHDLLWQCDLREGHNNFSFLRISGEPHEKNAGKVSVCYNCHRLSNHQRLNPHRQLNGDGSVDQTTCAFCHEVGVSSGGTNLAGNLSISPVVNPRHLCENCHRTAPHPAASPYHLGVPSMTTQYQMKQAEKSLNVRLPVDPDNGTMHCATCHNPHAPGVISDPLTATGGDAPQRLRSPRICDHCHDI